MRPSTVVAACLVAAASVLAADMDALKDTTPRERAAAQTAMMKSRLGLTDAQLPKIEAINSKYAERMDPIIKGSQGPLGKMRDARGVEQEKETELKGVLTPDQFQKFLAAKEEMREHLVERIREHRAKDGR